MQSNTSISVFFPAFNEEHNIEGLISKALEIIPNYFSDYEILIIDDGSKDHTAAIVSRLSISNPHISLIKHPVNIGYGAALKSGFKHSTKDLVFFTDADGQFDISEIALLTPHIKEADLIVGYRIKRHDPLHRFLFAKLYNMIIYLCFHLWVKDIDCAFKLIKRSVLQNIELKSNGALLSAELLIKAKKKGYKIKEVGVHHYPRLKGVQTGAKLSVITKAIREIFKFWRDLR